MMTKSKEREMKQGILDRLRQKGMPKKEVEDGIEEFGYVDEAASDVEEAEMPRKKKRPGPDLNPTKVKKFRPFSND